MKYSGLNKYHVSKPCTKCNKSGQCQRCNGKGSVEEKCSSCAGIGKAFSSVVATRVFHDSCNSIADDIAVAAAKKQFDLGLRYFKGEGMPQDKAVEAVETLRRGLTGNSSRKQPRKVGVRRIST